MSKLRAYLRYYHGSSQHTTDCREIAKNSTWQGLNVLFSFLLGAFFTHEGMMIALADVPSVLLPPLLIETSSAPALLFISALLLVMVWWSYLSTQQKTPFQQDLLRSLASKQDDDVTRVIVDYAKVQEQAGHLSLMCGSVSLVILMVGSGYLLLGAPLTLTGYTVVITSVWVAAIHLYYIYDQYQRDELLAYGEEHQIVLLPVGSEGVKPALSRVMKEEHLYWDEAQVRAHLQQFGHKDKK